MTTVGHDQRHVVSACFHHVRDKGVAEAVTSEAVGSAVVEICQSRGFPACPCDGIVKVAILARGNSSSPSVSSMPIPDKFDSEDRSV